MQMQNVSVRPTEFITVHMGEWEVVFAVYIWERKMQDSDNIDKWLKIC